MRGYSLLGALPAMVVLAVLAGCGEKGVDKDMHGLFGWRFGEQVEGKKVGKDPRGTSGIWEIEAWEAVPGLKYE